MRATRGPSVLAWSLILACGCGGAPGASEPGTTTQRVCFMEEDGTTRDCHEQEHASNRDFQYNEVRARCRLTVEGRYINCVIVRAPDAAHNTFLNMLRDARAKPRIVDGKPVESWVTLIFRLRWVDNR